MRSFKGCGWIRRCGAALRGKGQSAALLSGMLIQAQEHHPVISLYVNDFNTPAIRLYERLGFQEVGSLSTVHY